MTEKNILIAFLLNLSFSIFELIGGLFTNSISIISDAMHDFLDSISIFISYFLEKISKRKPDNKYTYGYARYSILGAIITNTILITGSTLVVISAVKRIINPVKVNYDGMIFLAFIGVIINFLAVYFTKGGKSLNQKAVNLHMLEDVLGWIVVLIGSILIKFTKLNMIDSILSILVAIFILRGAIKSFKKIIDLFLEKIPDGIKIDDIKKHLLEITGIKDIHHVHIWSLDGFNNYATMHIVTNSKDTSRLKDEVREELKEHGICHVTIEIEDNNTTCHDLECEVKIENHGHHH